MTGLGVRRDKAALSSGCETHPATAPAGNLQEQTCPWNRCGAGHAADPWRIVQRAEELGFTHAWFYDTQMLCADCFVVMGAAAFNTRHIRLGTGVLVPSYRRAPVTANALASLDSLAPGSIIFRVGTGFTARRAMGFAR